MGSLFSQWEDFTKIQHQRPGSLSVGALWLKSLL